MEKLTVEEAITEMQAGRVVRVLTLGGNSYRVTRIQKSFGQILPGELYVQYMRNNWAEDGVAPIENFVFVKDFDVFETEHLTYRAKG